MQAKGAFHHGADGSIVLGHEARELERFVGVIALDLVMVSEPGQARRLDAREVPSQ